MDEEQDFAYAVSAKALGHIAETAGRQASGVVAIRSRSAAVTDGVVHLHLAVRARYGSDLHGLALDVQQRAAEVIDAMVSGVRAWDMALRLGYDQVPVADTNTDLEQAVTAFVNANPGTRKHIYCTYTAMLKTRAVLGRITEVRDAGVGK